MKSFRMMENLFRQECRDKRVMMGFILGIALFGYWLWLFLRYVWDCGEPVNILEAFIVIEHNHKNMLFLALGWFLAISDAPFIKGNVYLALHRGSRKSWNMGVLLYVLLQAFWYVACLAAVSVIASSFWGFSGDMWSSPVYHLAMDSTNQLGVEYNIAFPWANIMRCMTPLQAFAVTFLFMWLYLAVLGVLFYVCNLVLREVYGTLLVFFIQISGYLLQQDGLVRFSFFAKSMPGYSIDGTGGHWKTALLFAGILLFMTLLSLFLAGRVDFKDREEEG